MPSKYTLRLRHGFSQIYERNRHIDVFLRGRHDEIKNYLLQFESTLVADDYVDLHGRDIGGRYARAADQVSGSKLPQVPRKYERRLKLLEYYNQTKLVRDIHLSNLSQEVRLDIPDAMLELVEDVDGEGLHYSKELSRVMKGLLAHGEYGILIDVDVEAQRSYHVPFTSSAILAKDKFRRGVYRGHWSELWLLDGYAKDKAGKKKVRVLHLETDADESPYRWKIFHSQENYDRINWCNIKELQLMEVEGEENEGVGSVPYIPFVMFRDDEEAPILESVQQMSYIRLNKKSAQDNIEYYQSFQRLIGHNVEPQALMILAEDGVTSYVPSPAQGAGTIQVIEPGDGTMLMQSIEALDSRIIKQGLKQIHTLSDMSRQNQSSESKARDADTRHEYYDNLLNGYEKTYKILLDYQAEVEGVSGEEIQVSTTRNYRTAETEINVIIRQQIAGLATQLQVTPVLQTLLKHYVSELRGISEDEKEELYEQIDASGNITGNSLVASRSAILPNAEIVGIE